MVFALSSMQLTSPAFADGGAIPRDHTGEGANTSPTLAWSDVPDGAASFAIICHDPDAPLVADGLYGVVHWVLYNIPASVRSLEAGTSSHTFGSRTGGAQAYGGPMPPPGHGAHRYYFWLIALNADLQLEPGLTMGQFLTRAEPNIIGMNRLVGTYIRNPQ